MEKGQGVKCGREAWEGGGDGESQGFPSLSPALSSQGHGGPGVAVRAWGRPLDRIQSPGGPAFHRPTPGCSGFIRLCRAGPHHRSSLALSPSPSRPRGGHDTPNVTSERHPEERREEEGG